MVLKMGMTPPHPGRFLRQEVIEPLNLTIEKAAEVLGVRRATLSDLLNGQAALSAEMALRFEKAFKVDMEMTLRMQAAYDAAQMRQKADKLNINRFVPA